MPTPLETLNKRFKAGPNRWAKRVPNGRKERSRSHRAMPRLRRSLRRRPHGS